MLDSHDTPRILTLAHGDEALALQALTLTFMQTGAPCLYYGTEMGMSGGDDPDDRKPMDWSKLGSPIWKRWRSWYISPGTRTDIRPRQYEGCR